MRKRIFLSLSILVVFVFSTAVHAEDDEAKHSLHIKSDTNRGAFVFLIDGEEVALLDKSGLYVPGSITFAGTMTDAGSAWVDDYIVDSGESDIGEGGSNEE